jgi:hypothetical protein
MNIFDEEKRPIAFPVLRGVQITFIIYFVLIAKLANAQDSLNHRFVDVILKVGKV